MIKKDLSTVSFADIIDEESKYAEISLKKLCGEIEDVIGYISTPFGDEATIVIHSINFKDGSSVLLHGEHDCVMIETSYDDQKHLERLLKEQQEYETRFQ